MNFLDNTRPAKLMIEGPSWPSLNFDAEDPPETMGETKFVVNGFPIFMEKSIDFQDAHHSIKTATSVWDCSVVLGKYLEFQHIHKSPGFLQGKRVLELGAGTGLAGLGAAALGAFVTLTDVDSVIPQLQRNIDLNPTFEGKVSAKPFDWLTRSTEHLDPPYDVIIASDVIWIEELIEPLVRSLEALADVNTEIILAYQFRTRRADELFFGLLEERFCWKEAARRSEQDPVFSKEKVKVFRIRRKPATEEQL